MKKIFTLIFVFLMIVSSNLFAEWEDCNDGLEFGSINCITKNSNFLFIGTDHGTYKSSNKGLSWEIVNQYPTYKFIIHENLVLVCADTYLSLSNNFGNSFDKSYYNFPVMYEISSAIFSDTIFVHTNLNLKIDTNLFFEYQSIYDGPLGDSVDKFFNYDKKILSFWQNNLIKESDLDMKQWNTIGKIPNNSIYESFEYDKNHFVIAYTSGNVYLSKDFGKNWEIINSNNIVKNIKQISIQDSKISLVCDKGIFYTINEGKTWELINDKWNNSYSYAFSSSLIDDNLIYLGSLYNGIFTFDLDSKKLNLINKGINNFEEIQINSNPDYKFLLNSNGVFKSKINVSKWEKILSQRGLNNLNFDDSILIALNEYKNNKFYYSVNQGNSWSDIEIKNLLKIRKLYFDHNNFYALTENGLFYSTDFTKNWIEINTKILKNKINQFKIKNQVLLIQDIDFNEFYSINNGLDWNQTTLKFNTYNIGKLEAINNTIFNARYSKIYKSTDYGKYWSLINSFNFENEVTSIQFYKNYLICYIHSVGLVFYNTKTDKIDYQDSSMANLFVYNMSILNDEIYLATLQKAVIKRNIKEIGISTEINDEPVSSSNNSDYTVYPNPSTDYLNIHFTNALDPNSTIKLFDILGNQVYQSQITSFDQDTKINLESLQSGVYLLKIADKVERIIVNK